MYAQKNHPNPNPKVIPTLRLVGLLSLLYDSCGLFKALLSCLLRSLCLMPERSNISNNRQSKLFGDGINGGWNED